MDANVIGGVLRAIVPALIAFAVAKGWIVSANSAGLTDALVVGIPVIIAAVWSIITNLKKA